MERRGVVFWFLLWLIGSVFWLSQDFLIRDGDEEGHVGAAELFVQILQERGFLSWVSELLWGNYGEYPPFFAATLGSWWFVWGEQPEHLGVRTFGLLFIVGAAVSTELWSRRRDGAPWIAFLTVLFSPLFNGIGRHFMIEIPLVLFSAILGLSFTLKGRWSYFLGGVALGFGLLCKQTFLIAVLPMVLWCVRPKMWSMILIAGAITIPWYTAQMTAQGSYITQSWTGEQVSWWMHILGPILTMSWELLGPILSGVLFFTLARSKSFSRESVWLLCALILFMIIPKKYPRLLLGLLPYVAVLISKELKDWSPFQHHLTVFLCACWLGWGSLEVLTVNPLREDIDERCPQVWLRPAADDLGMRQAFKWVSQEREGPVYVIEEGIPCELQTTHPFSTHLEIYLRRRGFEHEIIGISEQEEVEDDAVAVLRWTSQGVSLLESH